MKDDTHSRLILIEGSHFEILGGICFPPPSSTEASVNNANSFCRVPYDFTSGRFRPEKPTAPSALGAVVAPTLPTISGGEQ